MVYDVTLGAFDESLCTAAELEPSMFAPVRPSTEVVGTLLPDVGVGARSAGGVRGCRRNRRRARRVGRGRCDRGGRRRRRHRHRRTGDDGVRGTGTRPARPRRDARPRGTWLMADRESRIRQRWKRILARRASWRFAGRGLPLALNAPPASEGVLFLPALSGATAPRWNDRMRGGLLGLAMNHTPAHVARAVLEGCAFALRDIVERLDALGLGRGRCGSSVAVRATICGRRSRPVCSGDRCAAC